MVVGNTLLSLMCMSECSATWTNGVMSGKIWLWGKGRDEKTDWNNRNHMWMQYEAALSDLQSGTHLSLLGHTDIQWWNNISMTHRTLTALYTSSFFFLLSKDVWLPWPDTHSVPDGDDREDCAQRTFPTFACHKSSLGFIIFLLHATYCLDIEDETGCLKQLITDMMTGL